MRFINTRQRGELQNAQRLPTQFAHGGSGLSPGDEVPGQASAALPGVTRGRNTQGAGLGDWFAQQINQRVANAVVFDTSGREQKFHDSFPCRFRGSRMAPPVRIARLSTLLNKKSAMTISRQQSFLSAALDR